MKTNAPRVITLLIAVILAVLGIIGFLGFTSVFGVWAFWLVVAGFVVLLAGSVLKGL
ncbi:MAG: hypothetical protein FWF72_04620 [Paludibacter sp.]|nr:hypothetical protein [Paludibacter sp.]